MTLFANWTWNDLAPALLAATTFGVLGITMLLIGFKLFERLTPKLDVEQKLQEGNIAVGVVVGALLIAIAVVVSTAIH
jgi:putative membrane protein